MSSRALIIEHRMPPLRRILAIVLTTVGWFLWLLTWLPLLHVLLGLAGLRLLVPMMERGAVRSAFPVGSTIGIAILAASVIVIVTRHVWEIFGRPRAFPEHRARPVGLKQLAARVGATEADLLAWQAKKTLHVEHGDKGEVIRVTVTPEESHTV